MTESFYICGTDAREQIHCHDCGKPMTSGFVIDEWAGVKHYCGYKCAPLDYAEWDFKPWEGNK
ncbi:hypothetical protein CSV79_01705 [Sporosarcina sp. P13]|nr:hypothetical protein CSV79_01705 [Sporosarcina sp. P13]